MFFILLIVSATCVFPLLWTIMVSLKTKSEVLDPSIWFFTPTLNNYIEIFTTRNALHHITNSLVVVLITTALSILLGGLAAYGFARYKFRKKEDLAFWILSLRMLPPMAVIIPFFVMARTLHILDTQLVLIITYMLFNIPFTIWMMRSFFEEIPIDIEEAAFIDGCTRMQAFFKVILPLAVPGLIATAIFCIINSWNELVFAMFLTSVEANTLPTTTTLFLSVSGVVWGELAAIGVVTVLPVVVFAMIVQKHMIRGLTFGSVK